MRYGAELGLQLGHALAENANFSGIGRSSIQKRGLLVLELTQQSQEFGGGGGGQERGKVDELAIGRFLADTDLNRTHIVQEHQQRLSFRENQVSAPLERGKLFHRYSGLGFRLYDALRLPVHA